ncbi:MAG TPA: GNAT family N-acetyltransferase [Dehalococcoidia bacterium]|jgi:ribosomal protein S18 acetylase RimI-like enzyme
MVKIKSIKKQQGLERSVEVIRDSFKTVAVEFGLNESNCPTHPSLITLDKLLELSNRAELYGLFQDDRQVGFVAIEKAGGGVYYLDKLAVLPEYRHHGCGRKLAEFVVNFIAEQAGQKVSLGMIDESTVLKNWYRGLGFEETGTKKFDHLPFTVCFMDRRV